MKTSLDVLDRLEEADIRRALMPAPRPPEEPATNLGLRFPPGSLIRSASVLIPFLRINHHWEILFTRRTELVQDHKGQVSFPGGGVEPADRSPSDTALREAQEEIGLDPDRVKILGYMEPMVSRGGFRIDPVVGMIPWPFPLVISEAEVSRVFTIPLTWLADANNYEERRFLDDEIVRDVPIIFYRQFDGEILWGISGRITVMLIDRLLTSISK